MAPQPAVRPASSTRSNGHALGQPVRHRAGEDRVEPGVHGPDPRADAGIEAVGRVDVDAADDGRRVVVGGREHRVGEARAPLEVRGVADEVGQVLLGRHRVRPAHLGEARGREDVVHARGPGRVVGGVVLRPEGSEPEAGWSRPAGGTKPSGTKGRGAGCESLIVPAAYSAGDPTGSIGGCWCGVDADSARIGAELLVRVGGSTPGESRRRPRQDGAARSRRGKRHRPYAVATAAIPASTARSDGLPRPREHVQRRQVVERRERLEEGRVRPERAQDLQHVAQQHHRDADADRRRQAGRTRPMRRARSPPSAASSSHGVERRGTRAHPRRARPATP